MANRKTSMYNKYILLIVFVLIGCTIYGQKEPQYTQYMYNIGSFNPGYVGTTETPEITGLYRAQWVDIPGAPRVMRFGTNIPLKNETMGVGFNIISDQLGPATHTYIDAAYSYELKVTDDTKLSFGMDVGGSFLGVDFNKGAFRNPGEPILATEKINKFYPTIGAGAFMYNQDIWYLGLSIPNFLTDGVYKDEVASIIEDRIQFNLIGGYVFDLNSDLKFKPAMLFNYINGAPINLNLSANFLFSKRFTLGASYRIKNAASALAGFQINNSLFLGYSYDYNTNLLGEYNSGSHEVILKFYLGKGSGSQKGLRNKPKQIDTPRFF